MDGALPTYPEPPISFNFLNHSKFTEIIFHPNIIIFKFSLDSIADREFSFSINLL